MTETDGVLVSLRLSQGDLGRLAGLSRETVNAILQEWREQNLLEMDGAVSACAIPNGYDRSPYNRR